MLEAVIAALVFCRAELAGEMRTLQSRPNQVHAKLASLDKVIRHFDPEYQLETIRPRYRRKTTAETELYQPGGSGHAAADWRADGGEGHLGGHHR